MANNMYTSGLLLITVLRIFHLASSQGLSEEVELGEDAHLKCQSPDGVPVAVVKWTRPDLESVEHVFFNIDGHPDTAYQNPSFRNRVELRDKEMKNGDLTLTLKNVTRNDSGIYECLYKPDVARRRKRAANDPDDTELITSIDLKVVDPPAVMDRQDNKKPDTERPAGREHVVVTVVTLSLVISVLSAVVFVILRKQRAPGQFVSPDSIVIHV